LGIKPADLREQSRTNTADPARRGVR
jgi:hypothetical protein